MTKSLIWNYEKMIHAYASIWRCLMHDIIIEIREKACKHVHHLEIIALKSGNGNNCQPLYRVYIKGEEGVWGGGGAVGPKKPTE